MQLIPPSIITTAATVAGSPYQIRQSPNSQGEAMAVVAQVRFTYGSAGTSVDVYLQTSFDGGTTWCDVIHFAQLTTSSARVVGAVSSTTTMAAPIAATDGTQTVNTITPGLVGSWWRVKYISLGTYATSTTLEVDVSPVMVPAGVGSFN